MASEILLTLFLVFLNGFFVAAEFAIVKVRESQLETRAQNSNNGVTKLALKIVHNLDAYLAATQLGITLASLGLGWVGEPVVSKVILWLFDLVGVGIDETLSHQIALPTAFILISVLHIVLGELAPKSIAIQKAETTAIVVAYPLNFFYLIFRPFIYVLNGLAGFLLKLIGIEPVHGSNTHTTDELKYLIQQSGESGTIESEEYDIIRNAFDFSDRSVKQIMIPRNQVAYLNVDKFDNEELERLLEEGYSRIPCYENDVDNIVGLIHIKDLLKSLRKDEGIVIRDLLRPIIIAPENKKVGILLKEFQQKHIHMAVIVNEFGTVEGIVTMEDIIEEIVGEIQDEYDHENPIVEQMDEQTYKVYATAPINDINSCLPYEIPVSENNDTLAGVLLEEFGDIPKEGETIQIDHYNVEILEREGNKLITVKLTVLDALENVED